MEKSLQLVFKNASGSTKLITIANPKEGLTKAQTDEVMQKIVAANVFNTLGGLMEKPYKDIELTEKSELAEA